MLTGQPEAQKHAQLAEERPKKQARTEGNPKGALIEQPEEQKHTQPAKVCPINKQKRMETLKKCSLSNQKSENMNN